jgi:REP element-mobilizing transposase RayT
MTTKSKKPEKGSRMLRKGRRSFPGSTYFITAAKHPSADTLDNQSCFDVIQSTLNNLENEGVFEWFALTVMPDHVHLIIRLGKDINLSDAVKRFKGSSSLRINKQRGKRGSLWYQGFHDRMVRNHEPLSEYARYLYENPRRKGLVADPGKWPYSKVKWEMVA